MYSDEYEWLLLVYKVYDAKMNRFAASATAFYEEKPVLEFLQDLLDSHGVPPSLNERERVKFAKEMKGK